MKIRIFLSSRFDEFKDLRKYIVENKFKEIGLNIEIIALDIEELASFFSPKQESIEGVKDSNIYLLFIGKTYGTIPNDDIVSFTHREYKEAKRLGLPVLVFKTKDEDIEEEIKKLLDEIENNEIYGILTNDIEQDYELILNSLKKAITKLTTYGSKYIQKINQVSFELLKNRSEEFIGDIGDRYIGNKYDNIKVDITKKKKEIISVAYNFFDEILYIYTIIKTNLLHYINLFRIDIDFKVITKTDIKKEEVDLLLEDLQYIWYSLHDLKYNISTEKEKQKIYKDLNFVNELMEKIIFIKSLIYNYGVKKILLTGEALSGKTHIFCEVTKERLKNNQPTILFFGHRFHSEKSIVSNMIDLLRIELKEEEFLEALNILGKKLIQEF